MGEVVVITGASAGIGRATAVEFAKRGARLALIARDANALGDVCREVRAAGGEAIAIPCDVADAQAVEHAAARAEAELGPIDVWINNAMVSVFSPAKDIGPEEYRRVTEVTYLGQVYGTLAALARMRTRNRGTILLIGSGLAYRGAPFHSAYCGAKFALRGFFESVRAELSSEGSGVHLAMVHPSSVNTPFYTWVRTSLPQKPNAVKPILQPEVLAKAIFWAAHHHRRELRVGSLSSLAAHGSVLAPGIVDRLIGWIGPKVETQREPTPAGRRDNLFSPAPGHAVHGEFDQEASAASAQLWLSTHRRTLAVGLLGLAALCVGLRRRR